MSNVVKFGYISGFDLVFTAYQDDGSGRGMPEQPLPELAIGYYGADPVTALEAGDEVIAYVLDELTWEGSILTYLNENTLEWEGSLLTYDGNWLICSDSLSYDTLTTLGAVVGAQEYEKPADWYDLLSASISDISTSVGSTGAVESIDETHLTATGELRTLKSGEIGYVEELMKEI